VCVRFSLKRPDFLVYGHASAELRFSFRMFATITGAASRRDVCNPVRTAPNQRSSMFKMNRLIMQGVAAEVASVSPISQLRVPLFARIKAGGAGSPGSPCSCIGLVSFFVAAIKRTGSLHGPVAIISVPLSRLIQTLSLVFVVILTTVCHQFPAMPQAIYPSLLIHVFLICFVICRIAPFALIYSSQTPFLSFYSVICPMLSLMFASACLTIILKPTWFGVADRKHRSHNKVTTSVAPFHFRTLGSHLVNSVSTLPIFFDSLRFGRGHTLESNLQLGTGCTFTAATSNPKFSESRFVEIVKRQKLITCYASLLLYDLISQDRNLREQVSFWLGPFEKSHSLAGRSVFYHRREAYCG